MAAETGFLIDGELYPLPPRYAFDLDEWQVLWDYSRVTLEDFLHNDDEDEERAERFKNPAFLRGLMHIAYQRGNQDLSPASVKTLIGKVNMVEALSGLLGEKDDEGDDAIPLALTRPPDAPLPTGTESTPASNPETSAPSGKDSTNDTDAPESPLAPTGHLRSATSSISDTEISAA